MELSDAKNLDGLYRAAAVVEAAQLIETLLEKDPILTIGAINLKFSQLYQACQSTQWLFDLCARAGFETDFNALFKSIAQALKDPAINTQDSVLLIFAINIQTYRIRKVAVIPDEKDYLPPF